MADTFDVIMAAYPSVGLARQDFDGLVQLVKDKRVRTEGVILVEHDEDGEVRVTETGDHLGRKGLGWGGGVGAVVGLFSPPLLASLVVGAAAGGVAGKFARHRVESGIQTGIGEQLPPGSAGIIAVVNHADRLAAEQALPGSPMKSVAQMEHHTMGALKDALATAAGKFSPDRTVLPIPDPSFGGTIGRTLAQSQAGLDHQHDAIAARRRAERAAGADRRCRVRQPEHLRRPDRYAGHVAGRPGWAVL